MPILSEQDRRINGLVVRLQSLYAHVAEEQRRLFLASFEQSLVPDWDDWPDSTVHEEVKHHETMCLVPLCRKLPSEVWEIASELVQIGCFTRVPTWFHRVWEFLAEEDKDRYPLTTPDKCDPDFENTLLKRLNKGKMPTKTHGSGET